MKFGLSKIQRSKFLAWFDPQFEGFIGMRKILIFVFLFNTYDFFIITTTDNVFISKLLF